MRPLAHLIDTDCVIQHLNRVAAARSRLAAIREQGLALSVISLAELWEGVLFSRDPQRSEHSLQEFVSGVTVLGIDEETCRRFGRLRGSLRSRGKLVGDFDLLIAATALQHNLTLLSNNIRHFEQIEGLRLEGLTS
jgi:tRNA(fMet)-specific endonuclease VapC